MFKELRQLASLFTQAPRIREEMEKLQQRIGQLVGEGDAGGGMVRARVNGRMEILSLDITDDALKLNDREMLAELVRSACNQAIGRARQLVVEESGKVTGGLNLSGLGGLSEAVDKE
jgi:hypothetical protein